MGDITIEQIKTICGDYSTKSGDNYFFQCPICMDSHRDNLVYNSSRQIIKCFKDESHTLQVLKMINDKFNNKNNSLNHKPLGKNEFSIKQPKQTPIWEIRQDEYLEYVRLSQDLLLHDKSLLEYIYNKRGLIPDTLDLCGVGFDDTESCFTIPIFSLKHECITDFELRKYGDKKQIRRIGGGCSTIVEIYGLRKAKTLIINEGLVDAITMVQYMLFDKKQTNFTVYSCSNGVGSLLNVMNEINFSNFDEIKLMLDCDEAGDKTTKAIIDKYPFIKDARKFLFDSNCKDFNQWYVEKVR